MISETLIEAAQQYVDGVKGIAAENDMNVSELMQSQSKTSLYTNWNVTWEIINRLLNEAS